MSAHLGNSFIKAIINSPLHPLLGDRFVVITLTGRWTGKTYSTPINVIDIQGIMTCVSMRSWTWWRNLVGRHTASLRRNGNTIVVQAEVITEPQAVADGLAGYFHQFPDDAKFFKVKRSPEGVLDPGDLECAAAERVLIQFQPV